MMVRIKRIFKLVTAGLGSILLTSCYYVPDDFTSSLNLSKNGQFAFAFKGKIRVINATDMQDDIKEDTSLDKYCDDIALDKDDGSAIEAAGAAMQSAAETAKNPVGSKILEEKESDDAIPAGMHKCSEAELKVKQDVANKARIKKDEREKKEAEAFMVMMGIDPNDDDAMRELARRIERQHGYRSVTYEGKGVYSVDYAVNGPLDRDFVFPLFQEQREVLTPFVVVRRQKGGTISVTTPGYIAGGLKNRFQQPGLMGVAGFAEDYEDSENVKKNDKPAGRFTITTQGQFKSQNSGAKLVINKGTRTANWDIKPSSKATPSAVVKLK